MLIAVKALHMVALPVPCAVRWILRGDFAGLLAMAVLGHVIAHGL